MDPKEILAGGKRAAPKKTGGGWDTTADDMSAEDRIRGSIDVPLDATGQEQAKALGEKLAGKVNCIYTSPLQRAKDTAKQVLLTNPGAEFIVARELMPWKLGGIEGQPTKKVIGRIKDFVLNSPDEVPTGSHEKSTEPPESFNEFCRRVLGYLKKEFAEHEDGQVDLYVTHYRDIKALEAWLKAGEPSNFAVDKSTMISFAGDEAPGDLFKLEGRSLVPVDNVDRPDGIYFARHGKTDMNGQ